MWLWTTGEETLGGHKALLVGFENATSYQRGASEHLGESILEWICLVQNKPSRHQLFLI